MKDPYSVLGVSPASTDEEIKAAFRELAKKWHPDRNPDNKKQAEERFKEIAEAYTTLCDRDRSHDEFRGIRDDILFSFLTTKRAKKQMDVRATASLSLSESMSGGTFPMALRLYELCEACKGTGAESGRLVVCRACGGTGLIVTFFGRSRCSQCDGGGYVAATRCITCLGEGDVPEMKTIEVTVPEGIADATVLKLTKLGRVARYKGTSVRGELLVEIRIRPDPSFVRVGNVLSTTMRIPFSMALAGGKTKIKNPLGVEGPVVVPKACSHGCVVQVPRLGIRRRPMEVKLVYDLPALDGEKLALILPLLEDPTSTTPTEVGACRSSIWRRWAG